MQFRRLGRTVGLRYGSEPRVGEPNAFRMSAGVFLRQARSPAARSIWMASKSGVAVAPDALFAERHPSLVHGLPEDALRHEIGLSGKALLIDITL